MLLEHSFNLKYTGWSKISYHHFLSQLRQTLTYFQNFSTSTNGNKVAIK